jgi:hypothetical protein
MGFDLIGVNPRSEKGKYFYNNVWWWHPLWICVSEFCDDILDPEQIHGGNFNDPLLITERQANAIAGRLLGLSDQGQLKEWGESYEEYHASLPDEVCPACNDMREPISRRDLTDCNPTDELSQHAQKDVCQRCRGTGKVRPWACNYPFIEENVRKFAEFAGDSGGFQVY